jgi:hypothetical protein
MEWVQTGVARELTVDLPQRPTAAGTFTVSTVGGASVQSTTAALRDPVDTTLSAAAVAGAAQLTLTDVTGVEIGRRYLLGGREDRGGETVTVRAINGAVVSLVRRLFTARAAGVVFQSTRVRFPVAALQGHGRNHRVEYSWPPADAQPTYIVPFDLVRYAPISTLTVEDLRDSDPIIAQRLNTGTWLAGVIQQAWETLLRHLASKVDPGAVVGVRDLTSAHGYLVRALIAETAGPDAADYLGRMQARYREERDAAMAATAIDEAQTGVGRNGRLGRSIPIIRG